MAYGGLHKINGRHGGARDNPVSKYHIQLEYGDEQADVGRGCRTRLVIPNSQARTRTGKHSFSLFS